MYSRNDTGLSRYRRMTNDERPSSFAFRHSSFVLPHHNRRSRLRINCPLATSHNLMVLSHAPDDASVRPSGAKATLNTESLCPLSVRTSRPLATSHNLMVWSDDPDASVRPSGAKATLHTERRVPAQRPHLAPTRHIPQFDGLVRPRCQRPPIGRKGDARHRTRVPAQRPHLAPTRHIPQFDGLVPRPRRCQRPPIGRKGDALTQGPCARSASAPRAHSPHPTI
jgi:hypothetical protein